MSSDVEESGSVLGVEQGYMRVDGVVPICWREDREASGNLEGPLSQSES